MSQIIVAPEAEADIDAILDYIAIENEAAADQLRESIYDSFGMLAKFPLSGHARPDLAGMRRILFWSVGHYLIAYRPIKNGVEIAAVLHGSRDIPAVLRDRSDEEQDQG